MKCISWNVNGIRACMEKGFMDFFNRTDADFFCLQETKIQPGQIELDMPGYFQYYNYAVKKGYSGTAIFTKREPVSVMYGIGMEEHDREGRVITLEYDDFYMVTCYTPNSKQELLRLDYRMVWEDDFKTYLKKLEETKPVIVCGFTDEERGKMTALLEDGFIDTFRYFYPDQTDIYSWWSYRFQARAKNAGWRIDYFLTSDALKDKSQDAKIHTEILGSDHCPVELDIDL